MAESAVSTVVQRLGDLLIQEAVFLDGVNEEVYGMQVELQRMQSFLRDADRRQDEEESVKNWVSEIRETAYDAEDIIEEFALKVALRRRSGMVNVMKRYATLAKETIELHNVGNEIQIIKNRISSLTNSLQTYGIIQRNDDWSPGLGRQQQQLRRSYSHIVEEDIVGLEEDVKVLAEQLVNSNGIVSICGMGGIGKTTLAKKVYHNSKVRHHFDAFAWAYVSQQCQVREVWEGILFKLTNPSKEQREEIAKLRDEELVKRLYQVQLEKKCLVILDDIWTIPTWNNLCPAFPYWKTAGSKILLTTRKMDVALHPDPTCFLHVPPQLNDDESWELLKKKACVDNNYPDVRIRAEIERLGREMVGRCTGLPLAIIVLGGLLATKKTTFEWDVVRKNIISHLRRGKGDEQLLGVAEVLALSYHELPYQLKPCFLHLAHFPEDCEIQTKKMLRMWVAEGFVSSVYNGVEEETMEDVAQRYLGELVERCMVQVVERGTTGRIRTCRMHDLMRDLCLSKAKQENFLEVFNQSLASDHPADSFPWSMVREARSIGRLRRLAVVLEGDLHKFIPSGYKRNSHLRSLLYFHEKACHVENWGSLKSVFKNFKLLRVLDLEGIQSHGGKLPKEIGKLIHLRFLSLRDTDIDELPSTIGNLRYLQTLDLLTWNSTVQIPNVVWRLHRLRHLYLPESCGEYSYKWQLANLVNLQTLVNFPAEKCEITDLVRLNHLKKLVIDDPKFGAIFRFPRARFYRLQSLSFVSNEDSTVVQVIQGCPNLYKLHIEGQIEKLPDCQQFSANLAKLNLLGSKLTEDPMSTLEKLPNLRILRLQMDSFLGNRMFCLDKGFPQLKSLFLYDLPNLEEWELVEGAMANLFHLEISNCTSFKTVPEGLRFITSLREMEIRSMLKVFRTRLEHGGEDYYKVQHVPSIAFRYCKQLAKLHFIVSMAFLLASSSVPMLLMFLVSFTVSSLMGSSLGNFYQNFDITWGDGRAKILNNGELLTLNLDKASGSGFQSKNEYLFGKIDMQLKLVPGNSAGTVTAYYLSSKGSTWDEIDFEFLGNLSGDPYILHTNVFSQGKGNREQQFYLWFDPTTDFHTYSILWNPQRIIFSVDGTPIREFKNMESRGVPFPKNQPMRIYSSLWNADDWATRGGLVKTDWSKAPFTASYKNFNAKDACVWSNGASSCGTNSSAAAASSTTNAWLSEELGSTSQERLEWVKKNYMIYNYCTDAKRFPQGLPPECNTS